MSNITHARLLELINMLSRLKKEAESAVSKVRSIVNRGNSVVSFQGSIQDFEHFLRSYPVATTEIGRLTNILVTLNCGLEITFPRRSNLCEVLNNSENNDSVFYDGDVLGIQTVCEASAKEKKTVGTNTDIITVDNVREFDRESVTKLYDVYEDSILEMKYLKGDDPSQFWLGYYCDNKLLSHLAEIKRKLQLGELHRLSTTPVVGQFIIGQVNCVFRGCVISVVSGQVIAVDIDTSALKLLNTHDIWEIGDCFSCFPPQAILCKLWNIGSVEGWTTYLSTLFKNCLDKCNLVVTVKSIIPGVVPTFIIDLDAHDDVSRLHVNMNEWINYFVKPAIDKIKMSSLVGAREEAVFQDLDPYAIYSKYDSDSDSDSDVSSPVQTVADLQNREMKSKVEELGSSVHTTHKNGNESSCIIEKLDETQIRDSNELIFNRSCANNDTTIYCVSDNFVVEEPEVENQVNGRNSAEQIVKHALSEQCDELELGSSVQTTDQNATVSSCVIEKVDETPTRDSNELMFNRACANNETTIDCVSDDFVVEECEVENKVNGRNSAEQIVKHALPEQCDELEHEVLSKSCGQILKSSVVKCFLKKGKSLKMSFLRGTDPWSFFLTNVSVNEIIELKKKMAEKAESGLLIPLQNVPEVKDFAIGKYDNEYCRVRVNVSVSNKIESIVVTDIDSGETKFVSMTALWVLEEEFSLPPARAIRCSLWNIPRNLSNWCFDIQNLFTKVMLRGPCCVNVKDVTYISGERTHNVQIRIFADWVFDVSEWITNFIFPNLKNIKQCYISGSDVNDVISKLDPSRIFKKEQTDKSTMQEIMSSQCNTKVAKKSEFPKSQTSEQITVLHKNSLELSKSKKILANALKNGNDFPVKRSKRMRPKKTFLALISNVLNPFEFYVHLISEENIFMEKMQIELLHYCSRTIDIHFQNKKQAIELIPKCCAVYFKDKWFRGRIIDWFDDFTDNVSVFLVDYGILTTVSYHVLQPLRSDFYEYPVFAEKCALAFISPPDNKDIWPENSVNFFSNLLDCGTKYEIYVVNRVDADTFCVVLSSLENVKVRSINDYLVKEGCAVSQIGDSNVKETENSHIVSCPIIDSGISEIVSGSNSIKDCRRPRNMETLTYFYYNPLVLPDVGKQLPVVITEVGNMGLFYAVPAKIQYEERFQSSHEVLRKIHRKIGSAIEAGHLKLSEQLCEGTIVVARYSKDKFWYRARVLASPSESGLVEVFFVDFGNVDKVHKFYVREIIEEFCELPFQAMKLFIDSIDVTILKEKNIQEIAKTLLTSLKDKLEVVIKVTRVVNKDVKVKVMYKGRDIGEEMINCID